MGEFFLSVPVGWGVGASVTGRMMDSTSRREISGVYGCYFCKDSQRD